jgi:hypothetical protein
MAKKTQHRLVKKAMTAKAGRRRATTGTTARPRRSPRSLAAFESCGAEVVAAVEEALAKAGLSGFHLESLVVGDPKIPATARLSTAPLGHCRVWRCRQEGPDWVCGWVFEPC